MKRVARRYAATLGLVAMFTFSFFFLSSARQETTEVTTIEMKMGVTVGENIGFNVSNDSLVFGKVPPGGTSTRFIKVTNNKARPCKIDADTSGDMKKWVNIEKISQLDRYETRELRAEARIPKNAGFGEYSGLLRLIFEC